LRAELKCIILNKEGERERMEGNGNERHLRDTRSARLRIQDSIAREKKWDFQVNYGKWKSYHQHKISLGECYLIK